MASPCGDETVPIDMFVNRVKKNLKTLRGWRKAEGITCFRVYDKDIPEFAVAVDVYENYAHIQEYQPPSRINPEKSEARLKTIVECLPEVLNIPAPRIFLKVRSRQKGVNQYEKLNAQQVFHTVQEGGHQFQVNFTDYLDTGIFLDHRITRGLIEKQAAGKRFLNLFSYTGTASIYAAKGGAKETTTVDMSNTYLSWARRNFELNNLPMTRHRFEQADCFAWLAACKQQYDLIFMDPPTFSNSKRMKGSLDIQRDHVLLITQAMRLLSSDGMLIFSNNQRTFSLNMQAFSGYAVTDWSKKTLPKDFLRNAKIHQCWKITHQDC